MAASQRLFERLTDGSGVYFDGTLVEALTTPYQHIEVFDSPDLGKLMRIDGANMTSERDEFFYHENLVHPPALAHPSPAEVLIIGGGDGGSVEEVLKHPGVRRVVLAEIDAGVIEIARRHFGSIHKGAFDDPRVEVRIGDGMAVVCASADRFDLIYLDLTDPSGPAEALYSVAFFADCKRALRSGGALVLHIGSPFSHAARVQSSLAGLRSVFARVAPWFVHIPVYGATWGFASASDSMDPSGLTAAQVDALLQGCHIDHRQFYNGAAHEGMFAQPEYIKALVRT